MTTIRRSRAHPDIESSQLAAVRRAARADKLAHKVDERAARRFHAMIEAAIYTDRRSRLYEEAERLLDRLTGETV